jgi:hypothetical protein
MNVLLYLKISLLTLQYFQMIGVRIFLYLESSVRRAGHNTHIHTHTHTHMYIYMCVCVYILPRACIHSCRDTVVKFDVFTAPTVKLSFGF